MTEQHAHPSHGNTPAAWTAVILGLIAVFGAAVAVLADQMTLFIIFLALIPVSLVVGVVMSRMGFGAR